LWSRLSGRRFGRSFSTVWRAGTLAKLGVFQGPWGPWLELPAIHCAFENIQRRPKRPDVPEGRSELCFEHPPPVRSRKDNEEKMNQQVRTPRTVTWTLSGGFVLGAVCMAAVYTGMPRASAAPELQVKPRLMSSSSTESTSELHNLDSSFRNLAKFVGPAVVDIQMQSKRSMDENGARMPVTQGEGSGFIFSPDGYIATNDHVVGDADTVKVTLKDGREFTGKVTRANDVNSDIALVKIDGKNLPYISYADSSTVDPGEFAMAIGAPFGLENSVTVGHVSALGRSNQIERHVYTDLIQTDAAINMGNSGGPLVNVDGQVIGMNTAIFSPTGGSNGIGFAIPSNQVRLIENLLVTKGKVVRSMLGVIPTDVKEFERNGSLQNGGARVEKVVGEPAQTAGFQKDDVITRIGNTEIHNQEDLRNAMLAYAPGTSLPVDIVRNGQKKTLDVKLLAYKVPKELAEQENPTARGRMRGSPFQGFPFGSDPFGNQPGIQIPFGDENGNSNGDEPSEKAPKSGRATLGVQVENVTDAARSQYGLPSGISGAVVVGVVPDSVAAGIGMQQGDVVLNLNGKAITSAQDLRDAMSGIHHGDSGHIKFAHYDSNARMERSMNVRF